MFADDVRRAIINYHPVVQLDLLWDISEKQDEELRWVERRELREKLSERK